MKIADHTFTDGTVAVLVANDECSVITTELPSSDETEADCDTTLIVTRDPAVLLALAGSLVAAAAKIMPRDRAARGPGPAELCIIAAFAAELEALKLVDGAGI